MIDRHAVPCHFIELKQIAFKIPSSKDGHAHHTMESPRPDVLRRSPDGYRFVSVTIVVPESSDHENLKPFLVH